MDEKIILFQGGTHGNFLERYLNISGGYISKDFNFFTDSFGSHNTKNYRNNTNKIFVAQHPHILAEKKPGALTLTDKSKNIFCYIHIEQDDLYKLFWWTYLAAGNFGLNLINNDKNFTNIFLNHIKDNAKHNVVVNNISFQNFEKTSNGFREYFKTSFKKSNGFLLNHESIIKEYDIENYFYYKDFYGDDIDQKIKENLKIDVKIKTNNHKLFVESKKSIIESEYKVKSAVDAFINGQYYNLENFCLYEQAYFDHLIEEHYNIKLKTFYKSYPINTSDYKIQEDK